MNPPRAEDYGAARSRLTSTNLFGPPGWERVMFARKVSSPACRLYATRFMSRRGGPRPRAEAPKELNVPTSCGRKYFRAARHESYIRFRKSRGLGRSLRSFAGLAEPERWTTYTPHRNHFVPMYYTMHQGSLFDWPWDGLGWIFR